MASFDAIVADQVFQFTRALDPAVLTDLPGGEEMSPDLIAAVLEEAARFAEAELLPLNAVGDREGCTLSDGSVRTPTGFRKAYDKLVEGGWTALSADPEFGGQGLPHSLMVAVQELQGVANLSFSTYPGLSHGAYEALALHGTPAQQARFLPPLTDGTWTGTMCLTEPQCGTDLGLIRTKAEPIDTVDGIPDFGPAYRLTGTKIFISCGDHDLAENIVHLVLARLPEAPTGTKGISLFVVPKYLPGADPADRTSGARNPIHCVRLEEKMGLHGSATCQMALDGAVGWLVGAPHKGMRAMFTMMNAARLGVGVQGIAVAQAAYLTASAYARDRLQGRALKGAVQPDAPADPLIVHPDIRRMLLEIRSFVEGARGLAYEVSVALDVSRKHPDPETRAAADDFVALMTPIVKAFFTDRGYMAATAAQQVLGGHGYVRDWPVEQYVRDARIAMIYEGANGIHGLDLVGRKMPVDTGRLLRRFFHPADALVTEALSDPGLKPLARPLDAALNQLKETSLLVAARGLADPEEAAAAATDYLTQFGLVAVGVSWLRQARAAATAAAAGTLSEEAALTKATLARFWMTRILPQGAGHALAIKAGKQSLMTLPDAAF